ncbi:phosphosulfolactate synthase [Pusillimonas sp. ANT_WB101]|uniref:phosphosulfolactate synthase n=1 Tax=Pusillimonas sp. ANT_WB101 TaxID=2597356 RepID=UPI0011ED2397|nr:phosphosulfolactate synthase [Pusillimonas sp. ANT_WB101]KAA0890919.1 phosphosulfolactate synthase [Pusillimonas sp. ANT_WB101]
MNPARPTINTPIEEGALLTLPLREVKPRKRGITSIIDFGPDTFGWGGSESGIRNALECAADFIDYAKIFALNTLLVPAPTMQKAIRCYKDFGVSVYAGGILFEYAWRRNELDGMARLLRSLGLDALEVSENCVTLSRDERMHAIGSLQRKGIQVVYEFGAKDPEAPMKLDELSSIVDDMTELGIEHITLEQSELDLLAATSADEIQALKASSWFNRILIEADPYRFPSQHATLIDDFGADVNLANITLGQALRLEGLRRGIGRAVGYSLFKNFPA